MLAVGVRDLKNQLSQYLQQVKRGEIVYITEHNRIIAEISLPKDDYSESDSETDLEKLTVSGKLIKAKRNSSIKVSTVTPFGLVWVSIYKENRSFKMQNIGCYSYSNGH